MGLSVGVVGLGSRGLSVLERLVTLASAAVDVHVIDPTCGGPDRGAGVHTTDQPDYLLLNTTAAQVSMFPDAHTVGSSAPDPGPSLYDWVSARGLRVAEDGFTVGTVGRPVVEHDFLPRRLLGEYLGWFLGELLRRAPAHVRISLHAASAVSLDRSGDGFVIGLSTGDRVRVDRAVLTTGYTPNVAPAAHPRIVPEPYPLPACLDAVAPGESVAIGGFGLSAIDVISSFTVGRGGRFTASGSGLRYEPGGREPVMYLYSRSGAPCRARPEKVVFGAPYQPMVFTAKALDDLRAARGGRLDFAADVLPLIMTEMRVAYRRCQARLSGNRFDVGHAALVEVLDEMDRADPFDPAAVFDGTGDMLLDDGPAYQKWLTDVISRDLAEGQLGWAGSPLKAGLDVLRAQRDMFRYAVDFGGLTPESLEDFHRRIVPAVNRAVVGPQYERHVELLALVEAGLVYAPFGPAPTLTWHEDRGAWTVASSRLATPYERDVDWLVSAQVPLPSVSSSADPLVQSLAAAGVIRPHQPGSRQVVGVDLDPDLHPVGVDGEPDRRLWMLGPLCEGPLFYTNLVPSPGAWSRPFADAHRIGTGLLEGGTPC